MPDSFALANAFVRIRPTDEGFRAEADAKIKAALAGLDPKVKIGAVTGPAKLAGDDLRAYLNKLLSRVIQMRATVDDKDALSTLTKLQATVLGMEKRVVNMRFNEQNILSMQARILAVDSALDKMQASMDAASQATAGGVFQMGRFGGAAAIAAGRISLFNRPIGAFLGSIALWHLAVDVVVEFASVLIPATIALIAFGAAATGPVQDIVTQMQHINTVTQATGKNLYPLTGQFKAMGDAVRPEVYQLFGDALNIANARVGAFTKLAKNAGTVLDQLGARASVAIQTGGLSVFLTHAVSDLAKLGAIAGNIFGTIGNILHSMTGIGIVLLNTFGAVTRVMENFTASGIFQGTLKGLVALHGGFIYAGLAATAIARIVPSALGLVAKAVTLGANRVAGLGIAGAAASIEMDRFAMGLAKTADLPWGWIAVGVAGLGLLIYKLATAKDATQQWFASTQQALMQAPAVRGYMLLQVDQASVANRLAIAQQNAAMSTVSLATAQRTTGDRSGRALLTFYQQAHQQVQELTGDQKILTNQSNLYSSRLDRLAVVTGSLSSAQGLLIASGITMNQMLKYGTEQWLQILEQVTATQAAYRAMGQTAGILGADMNALNIAGSDQVTQMGNLNTAWDKVIGIVSGGQSTFIAFQQAIAAIGPLAKVAGASMNGLNAPSLALRSSWQAAFTSASGLIDALRNMTAISPNAASGSFPELTRAMKDTLLELIPFGKQSSATRSELVSLAQEINPNVKNFQELVKWLGNTKHPAQDLNKLLASMGLNLQDLAKDAANLASQMQSQMNTTFAAARLESSGLSGDLHKLGTDMGKTHPNATQLNNDALAIYKKLVNLHIMAPQAARDFVTSLDPAFRQTGQAAGGRTNSAASGADTATRAIYGTQKAAAQYVRGSPYRAFVDATAHGQGGINVSESGVINKATLESIRFSKHGWKVPGFGGGDKWPAMLEGGETVVPKHLTPLVAPLMHKYHVPGFQSGGFVGLGGQIRSLPGHLISVLRTAGGRALDMAMAQTVTAALGGIAGAARAQNLIGGSQALGGDEAANQRLARQLFPWPAVQWPYFVDLEMREAGFNRFARNRTSGAYGIPQALPPTKMPFAAQAAGGSHAGPQLEWMFNYIRQVYGYPANADAHEQSVHWYRGGGLVGRHHAKLMDRGGWVPPGISVINNRTGRPEHLTPGGKTITIEFKAGPSAYSQFLVNEIRKQVQVKGGGDVQVAFGSP